MLFSVEKPIYLLLLPILLVAIVWIMRKAYFSSNYKKGIILGLRGFILLLLVLAMAGLQRKQAVPEITTIFAVDGSHSTKEVQKDILQFIQMAQQYKTKNDKIGIVYFGENAAVEVAPAEEVNFDGFYSFIEGSFTNIGEGIKLASTLIPQHTRKKIVLISDGQENVEGGIQQAKLLADQGVRIDVLPMKQAITEEVQVTEVRVPKHLKKHQQFDIEVAIDSFVDTEGNLKLFRGKMLLSTQRITVRKGENKFIFSDEADQGGAIIYKAELEPDADTLSQNNVGYAYTHVEDIPHVLVIEEENSGEEIVNILQNSKLHIRRISPRSVPLDLDALSAYNAVLLANVSAEALDERFLIHLESYVKHVGGGVIVTGGENSYSLGGYFKTPLETILPVDMELKGKTDLPNLGMIIVTDRSGSMSESAFGLSRLELAKEAAIRAVDALHESDQIGVIAFDDQPEWTVKLQKVGNNAQSIQEAIGSISLGGGTSIIPGLREAYEVLKEADTKLKHIILLTDGQAEQSGYESLVASMKASGITLSTVAVGEGADVRLLENLATWGNGRYYYTDEFTDLPKIFTKETHLAGKTYIHNRSFYPTVVGNSPILRGIDQVALLHGYIATTAKTRAEVLLKSDQEDPILAVWRYGLGRTIAWTSDFHNQWTSEWLASDEGSVLIRNMVAWTLRKQMNPNIRIEIIPNGKNVEILAHMPPSGDITSVSAVIMDPTMDQQVVNLTPSAPGIFKGITTAGQQGAYVATIHIEKIDGDESVFSGFHIPYSPEYDIRLFHSGEAYLQKVAQLTGGQILKDPKDIFADPPIEVLGKKDWSTLLLILAIVLYILDIALRRIPIIYDIMERWIASIVQSFLGSTQMYRRMRSINHKITEPKVRNKKNKQISMKQSNKAVQEETSALLISQKKKRSGR